MRLNITLAGAQALTQQHYTGASPPLSVMGRNDTPQNCAWWRTPHRVERFNSTRHRGALNLYLALAARARGGVPDGCFPAVFEFTSSAQHRPDKGFIKMCLNSAPPLLVCRNEGGHLLFELTDAGRELLAENGRLTSG